MKLRDVVKKSLAAGAGLAGGVLLSRREHQALLSTRARAVSLLAGQEGSGLGPGLTGVVFSMNRAPQIYALLKSYLELVKHPAPLLVLYGASNEPHARAYEEVAAAFARSKVPVTFIRESARFKEMLPQVLARVSTRNIFFLVDDIVLIRPLDLGLAATIDTAKTVLSLRLGPHLRRSYTMQTAQKPPRFRPAPEGDDLLAFDWFEQGNEWADPFSVDGNIFGTAEIRALSRLIDFKAPNTYEGALKDFNDLMRPRRGLCYKQSKLVNLPLNRVQAEVANLSGNVSPEFLLEQWNKGLVLDTAKLRDHVPLSPHEEHALGFVKIKK
jgi:hypothetical protein